VNYTRTPQWGRRASPRSRGTSRILIPCLIALQTDHCPPAKVESSFARDHRHLGPLASDARWWAKTRPRCGGTSRVCKRPGEAGESISAPKGRESWPPKRFSCKSGIFRVPQWGCHDLGDGTPDHSYLRSREGRRGRSHRAPTFDRAHKREPGKTHSLKGGPDRTSAVHNLCRRDS